MSRYFKQTGIPTTEIGGVKIPRLVLGTLPFLGESYQGPEKNRTYIQRFSNVETTTELLRKAISIYGLRAIGIMPSEISGLSGLFFQAFKIASEETGVEPGLVACLTISLKIGSKPVDEYRRWITYYNIEASRDKNVAEKYFNDPILLCREGWKEKFPRAVTNLRSYSAREIRNLSYNRAKLEENLRVFKEYKVLLIELGSETDFLAMTGRIDIIQEILDYSKDSLGCPAILGIHHAGSTIPILENSCLDFGGYLTPLNKLGALMFPSKEEALKAIKNSKRPLIAIKPLAGGRIPPVKAFQFVYGESNANACMVGVASEEELEIDFKEARHALVG